MQTQNMIKFAVRKPVMNAESIVTSGLQTLGVGSEASNLVSQITWSEPLLHTLIIYRAPSE